MSEKTVKATKGGVTVEATYDFGDTLDEMREKFGDEVVASNAEQSVTINIQGMMRRMINQGYDEDAVKNRVAEYMPTKGGEKADPVEKFKQRWNTMSKDDREKLLEDLKNMES